MIHNGLDETTKTEQEVGYHIEMASINGWYEGGGVGVKGLWIEC